jgi:hypothetical protein
MVATIGQAPSGIRTRDARPASASAGEGSYRPHRDGAHDADHDPDPNPGSPHQPRPPPRYRSAAPAARNPQQRRPRARFAALVDLENAVIVAGGRIPAEQRRDLFEALDHHLAGMPVRAASGGPVVKACLPELAHRGWGLTLVSPEPDAADHALIEAGLHLTSAGVTDLVVVSGDHAFARLAPAARLHVITHPAQLSTALRLAATTVTHLPAPQAATRAAA